jgi:hypothetical protein
VLGDVVVATFKANSRNAALLEEYLRIRGEEHLNVCVLDWVVIQLFTVWQAVAKQSQNGPIIKPTEERKVGTILGKHVGTISNVFRYRREKV